MAETRPGPVTVHMLGTGDAFGAGGRLQTCILVDAPGQRVLLDCGATSLVALRRHGVDPAEIDTVLVTHLHGDHFGGLPWLLLDATHISRRVAPLVIAGPTGLEDRVRALLDLLYPGAAEVAAARVPVVYRELAAGRTLEVDGIQVQPIEVRHPSGSASFALRLSAAGKVVAFSGDTEWIDALVDLARDADLFICECSSFERPVRYHLDYKTIEARQADLGARRILLTHLGADVIARRAELALPCAEDGLRLEV